MYYSYRFLYVDTSYGIVNSLAVSGGPFDNVQSRKVLDDFAKIKYMKVQNQFTVLLY